MNLQDVAAKIGIHLGRKHMRASTTLLARAGMRAGLRIAIASNRRGRAAARRRIALRDRGRAADLRLPRNADLRRAAAGGAALFDAAARSTPGNYPNIVARRRRELERVPGPADLHLQAAPEREIPRRNPLDLGGCEGHLRAHRQSPEGRHLEPQGLCSPRSPRSTLPTH